LTIKLTPYTEFRSSGAHSHLLQWKRTLCYPSDIQLSKIVLTGTYSLPSNSLRVSPFRAALAES
jgi:hypothetical protein